MIQYYAFFSMLCLAIVKDWICFILFLYTDNTADPQGDQEEELCECEECEKNLPMRERRRKWRRRRQNISNKPEAIEPEVRPEVAQCDPQALIPEGATFDLGRLSIEPGHGDRPNKRKLKEGIKEKVKTKGKANKHLQKRSSYDQYDYSEYTEPGDSVEHELEATDCVAVGEGGAGDCETEGKFADDHLPVVATELPQTVDDREFNMVPEEILRKEVAQLFFHIIKLIN